MNHKIVHEWENKDTTTPDMIRRATSIVNFLPWASAQNGRHETYLRKEGYHFLRSVSVYGHHDYEFVESDELAELVIRFMEEDE